MKKIILFTILTGLFAVLPFAAYAQSGSDSVENILQEIRTSQNVSSNSAINCEKVSNGQMERLGDAVMGVMHPDENQHELMDQMMGGEGSESLKAAHIMMGKQYLGCVSGVSGGGMMGMGNMMVYGGMMNWGGAGFGWNWLALVYQFLFLFLLILAAAALIKWLSKK